MINYPLQRLTGKYIGKYRILNYSGYSSSSEDSGHLVDSKMKLRLRQNYALKITMTKLMQSLQRCSCNSLYNLKYIVLTVEKSRV